MLVGFDYSCLDRSEQLKQQKGCIIA
jgi:hypothetical protein